MKRSTPWSYQKKSTKIGPPYICQRTKESFNSSIKGNLQVFQNHAKQAKIKVVFPFIVRSKRTNRGRRSPIFLAIFLLTYLA